MKIKEFIEKVNEHDKMQAKKVGKEIVIGAPNDMVMVHIPENYKALLKGKFLYGQKAIALGKRLNVCESTFYKWQRKAFISFANSLFIVSSQENPKHPINFRIYEGDQ